MKLLALDTSTEACSVSLFADGELWERHELAPRRHAELVLPFCEDLLSEAGLSLGQLDGLAVGRGPGSFTGVRIAAAVIQGVAFAADLPVVPVSSLAALAQGAWRELGMGRVLAAIDARMGEVYWAAYRANGDGLVEPAGPETVCPPEAVPVADGEDWFGAGSGWGSYHRTLEERLGGAVMGWEDERFPRARDIAVLAEAAFRRGEAVAAERALPVYLRDQVARKKA